MAQDPLLGTLFAGRFRVQSLLGQGGMGTVYLVWHEVLERYFALKLLQQQAPSSRTALARFQGEARAAARIESPHVISIYDFGFTADGTPYLVMEHLEGTTLETVVRREGALPRGRALELLEQVADGLCAAHAGGVVHRDLKPQNIMLIRGQGGGELAKIVDFGLALMTEVGTLAATSMHGFCVGTPEYIAPEQITDQTVDFRADLYAFGIIAFELLSGSPPFTGPVTELLSRHVSEVPPLVSQASARDDIPPQLDHLVRRCLAKDPADRYPSAAELVEELRSLRRRLAGGRLRRERGSQSGREGPLRAARTLEELQTQPHDLLRVRSAALRALCLALRDRGYGSPEVTECLVRVALLEEELDAVESILDTLRAQAAALQVRGSMREGRLLRLLNEIERDLAGASPALEEDPQKTLPLEWLPTSQALLDASRLEALAHELRAHVKRDTSEVAVWIAKAEARVRRIDRGAELRGELEQAHRALVRVLQGTRDGAAGWGADSHLSELALEAGV